MASGSRKLTDAEIAREIERIMNGEESETEEVLESDSSEGEDAIEAEVANSESDVELSENDNEHGEDNNDSEEDNIPLAILSARGHHSDIVLPSNDKLKSKNGHRWSSKSTKQSKRISRRNIIHFIPGSKGCVKDVLLPESIFRHFFNDEILERIVTFTNEETRLKSKKYKNQDLTISETSKEEILALIGILILSDRNEKQSP